MKFTAIFATFVFMASACAPLAFEGQTAAMTVEATSQSVRPTLTPSPTFTPSPTPIPYGGGGVPLVAYIGGDGEEGVHLIIGDLFNNEIYYTFRLSRQYLIGEGSYPQAVWWDTMPVAWSPDGKTILFVDDCGEIGETEQVSLCAYDINNESVTELLPLHPDMDSISFLNWSPDGKYISFQTFQNRQFIVYLIDYNENETVTLPNAQGPMWGREIEILYFNYGNWSAWSSYNIENRQVKQMPMQCESREFREIRASWACVGYVPELKASLVQQDNKDGSAYLLAISQEREERILCLVCNSYFNYRPLLFSPDLTSTLVMSDGRTVHSWSYTQAVNLAQIVDPLAEPSSRQHSVMRTGIAWAPDSSSFFAYRDDNWFYEKPLLLFNAAGEEILYRYDFPVSSWGVQRVDGHYPALDIHWPAYADNELYALIYNRAREHDPSLNRSSSFAEWVPQLQGWAFDCVALRWNELPGRKLIPDTLFATSTIDCEYKDSKGESRVIELAVAFDLPQSQYAYGQPVLIVGGGRGPDDMDHYLGSVGRQNFPFLLTVVFGMPSRANLAFYTLWHDWPNYTNFRIPHADFLDQYYTQNILEEFAESGDPRILNGQLVPIMTMGVNFSICEWSNFHAQRNGQTDRRDCIKQ